jgi:hypothetical protein
LKQKGLAYTAVAKADERGPQNEGKSNDVVQNKCRENVSLPVWNDVDEN